MGRGRGVGKAWTDTTNVPPTIQALGRGQPGLETSILGG